MERCNLCPRGCYTDRENTLGFCKSKNTIKVAKACLHLWEEPCISGKNGTGTVFFSGCNLSCIYCQNHKISHRNFGKEITAKKLREIFENLIKEGAHSIELVTPTHFTHLIKDALIPKLPVPVIYNCGGYESVSALKNLEGLIDIYMPDMKYGFDSLASALSFAPDYCEKNLLAIKEMYRQVGDAVTDSDGLLKKGVIVRHLLLPSQIINTKAVIKRFAEFSKGKKVIFSLMAQYTPPENFKIKEFPDLMRKVNERELKSAVDYLSKFEHIEGYTQSLTASGVQYIPDFNLSGI